MLITQDTHTLLLLPISPALRIIERLVEDVVGEVNQINDTVEVFLLEDCVVPVETCDRSDIVDVSDTIEIIEIIDET